MVVFTCNHCGDSVKKTAVLKHYNTKCRGAPVFLTCMDCLKDFRNEEYIEHTKCVSELQRYSGKDFVAKESENKGQKKQDSWIEIIRSILTSPDYNLKPHLRSIFEKLQTYENVPRKKVKFQNFISNSFKINKNLFPEVWEILEKENAKLKGPAVQADATKSDGTKSLNGETKVNDIDVINDTDKKKKKDKKNKNKCTNETNGETNKEDVKESSDVDKKKSKKRKIKQDDTNSAIQDELNTSESLKNGIDLEPKKKKEKKTKEKEIDLENGNANDNIVDATNFDWYLAISEKVKDGMNVDKLKKKVLKKYKTFLNCDEFKNENKVEKTFKKYLKKSAIKVENDICSKIIY